MDSVRCVVTARSPIVLAALTYLLDHEFLVRSVVLRKQDLASTIEEFRPHVVIIDCEPGHIDLQLQECIGIINPRPAVIFLAEESSAWAMRDSVNRDATVLEFIAAVRNAARKIRILPKEYASDLRVGGADHQRLSIREQQVLRGIALGKRMKEVARELGITPRTVAFHKYRAMRANGLKNNYDLFQFCIRRGLVDTEEHHRFR